MIFYNKEFPNSTVTSKKNNKRICEFKDGKFKTDNETIIKKLKPYFKHKVKAKVLNYWELKTKVEKLGIKTYKMKKADLTKALEESEMND
jgi:hypothetical protein